MENEIQTAPAATEEIDLAQIKTMLDLPETASDLELITVLVNLVATLQEKYEGLLADAVALEDDLTNRDLAEFSDVVDEFTKPFWKEQILQNRSTALKALVAFRNRLAAIDRTVETVSTGVTHKDASSAVRIRNRAHDIAKADGVPFLIAFARAEKEITKE
jgi:hypothetical protein